MKKTKLIFDISGIIHASFHTDIKNSGNNMESNIGFLRHNVISQILHYKTKFKINPEDVYVCFDHKHNWRKDIFSYYKASRKKLKEKSKKDYKILYEFIDQLYDDLVNNFPYNILQMKGLEADDIIALLSKKFNDNETKFIILSRDKDFHQLHNYKHLVFQYDPIKQKSFKDLKPKDNLLVKILNGDAGDGIPNVASQDDIFVIDGKRQTSVGIKLAEKLIAENRVTEWVKENGYVKNWNRNNRLINLRKIPENLINEFNILYIEYERSLNKIKLINYLKNNELKKLSFRIEEFYRK